MEHRFDVVAVGVEDERAVVARVVAALTRSAVVATSRGDRGCVPRADSRNIRATARLDIPARSTNKS